MGVGLEAGQRAEGDEKQWQRAHPGHQRRMNVQFHDHDRVEGAHEKNKGGWRPSAPRCATDKKRPGAKPGQSNREVPVMTRTGNGIPWYTC